MKEIDIEKELYPEKNLLKVEDGLITATIVDAELDGLDCSFLYDDCVEINTEGLAYIKLSIENLNTLKNLIKKAEIIYNEIDI